MLKTIGAHFLFGSICCAIFLFNFSCTQSKEVLSQKVVLKAEYTSMTAEDFAKILAEKLSAFDALTAKDMDQINRAKIDIEREFVIKALVESWAKRQRINIENKDVDLEITKIRGSFPNDLSFRQELSKQGISFNDWQKKMAYLALEKKVFSKITARTPDPTDQDVSLYYESHKDKYIHKEKVFLRQIVLANEASADKIQEALKSNKKFESLAGSFSIAPEAKQGGLVGWVEKGTLDVFDKAFELPLNTPSASFSSPYGFHILRVESKLPAGHQTLNEVKNSIVRILKGQKEQALFKSWLDKEVRQIHVYKDHKMIQAMSVETRGN